jgi:hypothetical protein
MSEASEHDRHYRALGLNPGASLQEIEESWRLRSAGFHPDKFPATSKDWATRKTQEINHARDELRRILREEREAAATEPAYQPHIDRVAPEANPKPPGAPDTIEFRRAAVLGSPEAAGLDGTLAAGLGRRVVWSSAAAALLALLVVVAGSAALLRGGAGAQSDSAVPVAADGLGPPGAPPSGSPPTALPPPPAAHVAVAALATGVMPQRSETSTEKPLIPGEPTGRNAKTATADPQPAAGIDFPADPGGLREPNGPSPQSAPQQSGFGAEDDFGQIGAPPAAFGHSFSGVAAEPAERSRRDPLVATAIRACRGDRQRFCADVKPGGGRLAQCARQHFKELSGGCSRALLALRDARRGQSTAARSGQH